MNWEFGGGNGTDSVGQKVLRTFDKPGDYNVTLSAKDSATPSQNTSASMLITISPVQIRLIRNCPMPWSH